MRLTLSTAGQQGSNVQVRGCVVFHSLGTLACACMQGYCVLHALTEDIPHPRQPNNCYPNNANSVQTALSNLFQYWANQAAQSFAQEFKQTQRETLRPSPRLTALMLHTVETSSAFEVGAGQTVVYIQNYYYYSDLGVGC